MTKTGEHTENTSTVASPDVKLLLTITSKTQSELNTALNTVQCTPDGNTK